MLQQSQPVFRIRVAFDISLGGSILQHGGTNMSSNWAADAAERLRKSQETKRQQDAVMLERRQLLKEQGPNLWIQVREFLKTKVLEFNKNYGQMVLRAMDTKEGEFDVKFQLEGTVSEMRARFEATSSQQALTWTYSGAINRDQKAGSCSLHVHHPATVVFQDDVGPLTPEAVADKMLDGLIPN